MAADGVDVIIDGRRSFTYGIIQRDVVWYRIPVIATRFTGFDLESGAADVTIRYSGEPLRKVWIRRLGNDVPARVNGNVVRFRIDRPGAYQVEIGDDLRSHGPLVIFANRPQPWVSRADDINFPPGTVTDVGVLYIRQPGQRIYIAGGAVVRGIIMIETHDVTLAGNGLIVYDEKVASDPRIKGLDGPGPLLATSADGLSLHDLTVVVGPREFPRAEGDSPIAPWAVHVLRSSNVSIKNLKIFNSLRDGLDIDGADHVVVQGGYVQSLDDSLCIKAINYGRDGGARGRDVTDVTFEGIMAMNSGAARVLMIGTELHAAEIARITYRNIDILHALPPRGVAISIANGDRADVHDISYDDVRILDHPDRLLNFTLETDGYRPDASRGQIHDIALRGLRLPAQISLSLIRGMPVHIIRGVRFEDMRIDGKFVNMLPGLTVEYAKIPQFH
jgi:hypothetical protein